MREPAPAEGAMRRLSLSRHRRKPRRVVQTLEVSIPAIWQVWQESRRLERRRPQRHANWTLEFA